MAETIKIAKAVKRALQCDGIYLTQSNEPAAGQDVFHFHLHVYPCWEGKEVKAIGRFVRSVTDRKNVTDEMKATMMRKIREELVTVQLTQEATSQQVVAIRQETEHDV